MRGGVIDGIAGDVDSDRVDDAGPAIGEQPGAVTDTAREVERATGPCVPRRQLVARDVERERLVPGDVVRIE
jgi:hypothetical protein